MGWTSGTAASGTATSNDNPFGNFVAPAAGGEDAGPNRPPLLWLLLGLLGPVLGLLLLLLHGWIWNVVGWAVAIVLGLGMLVVFTTIDLRRRTSPWYLARPGIVGGLRLGVAAAAIVVAGVHAYFVADYIARLDLWA